MKIALYKHHHELPFWHDPYNPYALFDPTVVEDWICKDRDGDFLAKDHLIMHVLKGLLALDIPGVMAHVSFIIDVDLQTVKSPKRCWVQITTQAAKNDDDGLPIVIRDNKVQVTHLWGGDNGTYSPYGLLPDERDEHLTAEFWTNFFLEKLRKRSAEARQEAREAIDEAKKTIQAYNLIPATEAV